MRVVKAADALRPGGWLATISTHHIAGGDESFFAEAQTCYERWDPETPPGGVALEPAADIPHASDELDRSTRFGPARFRRYEWELPYTTASYLDLLRTYSGHRDLDPGSQAGLLGCIAHLIDSRHGGRIVKRYLTELRVAPGCPAADLTHDPPSVSKGLRAPGQVRRAGQLTSSTPVTTATKPSANGPLRRSPRRRIASRAATTGFRLT